MRGRLLKLFMVLLVLIPVGLSVYLANSLYHRKGVPEALEELTRQLFQSKEEERKAEKRAEQLERKTVELQSAYDALVADLRGEVDSREVRVRRFGEKLEINFVDKVLFDSGSAEVTPHGREVLAKVRSGLSRIKDKGIYVLGHTDTMPIHSALYVSNWELSTARAAAVIRFLSETGGVPPERFTAMGRAFYQPVASNATPEGRQENRRVELIVADVPRRRQKQPLGLQQNPARLSGRNGRALLRDPRSVVLAVDARAVGEDVFLGRRFDQPVQQGPVALKVNLPPGGRPGLGRRGRVNHPVEGAGEVLQIGHGGEVSQPGLDARGHEGVSGARAAAQAHDPVALFNQGGAQGGAHISAAGDQDAHGEKAARRREGYLKAAQTR